MGIEADGETSILEDIKAAQAELRGDDPPETPIVEEAVTETAQQVADRERDEAGRFKAKTPESKTLTLKQPVAQQAPPLTGQTLDGKQAPAANGLPPEIDKDGKHLERIAPPQSWKGSAKVNWDRLPRAVREEISREYGEVDSARGELAPLKELFDVNREFLVNQAGSVSNAMAQMMQFARLSVDNPVQLAEHILRSKGLDPRAVFGGQPGQAPQQNQQPDLETMLAKAVDARWQTLSQQRETQQLQTQIDQFGADPKYPYFNDVRSLMGAIMSAGKAKSMEEAYEQATRADPTIWAAIQASQSEAGGQQRQQAVQTARLAQRTNLKGSPLPNGASAGGGKSNASVLDDVRAAAEELRA